MKDLLGKDISDIENKKLFLYDLDGTVYLSETLYPKAIQMFDHIRTIGGKYVFITNNSTKGMDAYLEKLNRLGIPSDESNFYTPVQAAIDLFKIKFKDKLLYVQGTKSFVNEIKKAGFNVTTEFDKTADVILVGFDNELTDLKIQTTTKMLKETNIPYYATNPDLRCPVNGGFIPDCGAMCNDYAKITGKYPIYLGKPEFTMVDYILKTFHYTKEETIVIGDRLTTDIAVGERNGIDTVLVLCGDTTMDMLKSSDIKPTYVFDYAYMMFTKY